MGQGRIAQGHGWGKERTAGGGGLTSLLPAMVLLAAGISGLIWIGLSSTNPDSYIRAVSGWLFFP